MSVPVLRLGRWFHASSPEPDTTAEPRLLRAQAQRKLYEDIGDFLFVHALPVSDGNFAIARAYLDGDREVGKAIEILLRSGKPLSDAAMATIIAQRGQTAAIEQIGDMASQLSEKLVECLHIINRSSTVARSYGAAVERETRTLDDDTLGTVERLLKLSREAVAGAQALGTELDQAREETERLRSHLSRARREADHDHLTGLLNRRSFENRLAALPLKTEAATPRCVALCDIDRFKALNDKHGHDTGDRVLRYFARKLRDLLAGRALVARYGGEEFACLFENIPVSMAAEALDEIRTAIENKPLVSRSSGQSMPPLTFSAGVAAITGDPRDALIIADQALYDAKHAGRNRVISAG